MENLPEIAPEVIQQSHLPTSLKFYNFDQSNPGGYTKISKEDGIGGLVIIQATDYMDANRRAQAIGIYFDGVSRGMDCSCCGDRWHEQYDDDDATDQPMYMDMPIHRGVNRVWSRTAAVHYADGLMKFYDARDTEVM